MESLQAPFFVAFVTKTFVLMFVLDKDRKKSYAVLVKDSDIH